MITKSPFKPAWWLPGPHLQTLWPVVFRSHPQLLVKNERIELPDGDFLDIAWIGNNPGHIVLVLHGLEGSITSHYAGTLLKALDGEGFKPVFMHFRGCSGEPNRLPRSYHSGETGDLDYLVKLIEERTQKPLGAAIGFSLGGNVLLKWLAEQSTHCRLKTAIAVSVPFLLGDCASRLEKGTSRLYQSHLLRGLRRSYKQRFSHIRSPFSIDVDHLRNFWAFDHHVTAPLHGFDGVDDYYGKSSSRQYLRQIETPTLILHARDDPFMWPETLPDDPELSPSVKLELSERGGHVGFVAGTVPWKPRYWLETRILKHLFESLQ
jgi:predicted alpha/beta-fold hydrolase